MNPKRLHLINSRGFIKAINLILVENAANYFKRSVAALTEKREYLTGTEWADKYRVMGQSSRYRKWLTSRTPYLQEIADKLSGDDIDSQVIVLMKSAQSGGSEVALNEVLRRAHIDPCTILYYMEAEHKVKGWMRDRLDPAFRREPFSGKKIGKDGLTRTFAGGSIICNGIGSSASLSSVTSKFIVGDEAARYPISIGGEGDFLSLARQRCSTFGDAGKIFLVSTPIDEVRGEGSFVEYYEAGDAREYECPCLHCGEYFIWQIELLKQVGDEAVMVCPHCGGITHDGDERADSILNGRWKTTKKPQQGVMSFHISSFIAPGAWRPLIGILEGYHNALAGKASLQSFYNLILGLPFNEPEARVPESSTVERLMKAEPYRENILPDKVAVLTMAVDVQSDYIDLEVKGWCENLENYSIMRKQVRVVIDETELVVEAINEVMRTTFQFADGRGLKIKMGCIDEGYNATKVHKVTECFPQPAIARPENIPDGYLTPTKGASVAVAERLLMGEPGGKTSKGMRRFHKFWRVGTDVAKRELYIALKRLESNPKKEIFARPHAPIEYKPDHFAELISEQIQSKMNARTGRFERTFYLPPRTANEALDLHVMNRAAAGIMRLDEYTEKDWRLARARIIPAGIVSGKVKPSSEPPDRAVQRAKRREARQRYRDKKRKIN